MDEAYALTPRHESDFGHQAIATLIKRLEDDRDKVLLCFGWLHPGNERLPSRLTLGWRAVSPLRLSSLIIVLGLIKIAQLQLAQCGYGYDENVLLAIKRYILIAATGG